MAISNIQSSSFNLADDVDIDNGTLRDPVKLLEVMNEKYHRQKTLYKETRDYYYKLNLFVFFLPLLIVQGVTTVLTHMASDKSLPNHESLKIVVAVLNGMSSVWAAAQLKLGLKN
ncbi:uncharacterized protein LOC142345079 [Convolutriloba macropyga]|uniref:uncharacterized protein LOC142345079 n=1 Tax=Convolutriloba macropyga TaxID=536237 RepID=UPI003F51BD0C